MLEWIKKQMSLEDEEDWDEEARENQAGRPIIIRAHLSCYEDAIKVADHLGRERIVIMDLCDLEAATAQRVIDFMCGAAYMAEGSIARLASGVYLVVPLETDYVDDMIQDLTHEPKSWEEVKKASERAEPPEEGPEGPDPDGSPCGDTEAESADAPEPSEETTDRPETAGAEPAPRHEEENDRP